MVWYEFDSDEDQILITQTDSIEDSMIDDIEEVIEENPGHSPSIIVISVIIYYMFSFPFSR